jgi:hypothetical protein
MDTTPLPAPDENGDYPGFASEQLRLDVEAAGDVIHEAIAGLVETETANGTAFRTRDGMLLAVLRTREEETGVDLYYRTEPPSDARTLKARRLWRALEPHAD